MKRRPSAPGLFGLLQAPLWGLARVFALEAPELWGGLIDLPSAGDDSGNPGSLLPCSVESEAIVTELLSGEGEDQVALRFLATNAQNSQGDSGRVCRRFVARLRSHPAQQSRPQPQTLDALCRPDGVYLITGGLGALGLACARFLVEQGARYLLLSGRHASLASLDPRQLRVLEELASAGAQVRMLSADVADHLAMERGLQLSLEAFGRDNQNSAPFGAPRDHPRSGSGWQSGAAGDDWCSRAWCRAPRQGAGKLGAARTKSHGT